MWSFAALCDEFHVSSRLYFKLDLTPSRESLLHFFDRMRLQYPNMTRMRRRDDGGLVLDEDAADVEGRRLLRVDRAALKFGYYGPSGVDAVLEYGAMVLSQAPAHLTLSTLDMDYMEVAYTFDLEYRGNHDELVAETLFADHPLYAAFAGEGQRFIDCQPFLGIALGDECDLQAYLEIRGRTSTAEVRSGEYEASPLSVCLAMRRYAGSASFHDLTATFRELLLRGEALVMERAVPHVVQPLAAAIASRR
jgi:hypothetical protein